MRLTDPSDYYADRGVEHTAQGDIYAGIPFVQAIHAEPGFHATGAPRIARLTADATRILQAAIIQTYTASNLAWESLADPDMTDGWAVP
ncbi:MAG: hypothetical protein MSC31_05690 [Solirubrobacteraceae bacterium MAG38_C4-C5]|nr:hypothetical protein [Candidatus Siliceabacter maunaloa]